MLRYMYIGHAIQFRVSEALNFKLNINRKQKQIFIDQTRMCFTLTPCGVCVCFLLSYLHFVIQPSSPSSSFITVVCVRTSHGAYYCSVFIYSVSIGTIRNRSFHDVFTVRIDDRHTHTHKFSSVVDVARPRANKIFKINKAQSAY